jgi:hypothetical protein
MTSVEHHGMTSVEHHGMTSVEHHGMTSVEHHGMTIQKTKNKKQKENSQGIPDRSIRG